MNFFELITIILTSTTKFIFAFPIAIEFGLNFFETFLITTIGGISGVLFFAYLTKPIINAWYIFFPRLKKKSTKTRRKFTRRNRNIVKIKTSYGLWGLAMSTPVILSIPIGTFFTIKTYPKLRKTIPVLLLSVVIWSLGLSFAGTMLNIKITDLLSHVTALVIF